MCPCNILQHMRRAGACVALPEWVFVGHANVQEKLKRMSPAEREKYKARAEKLERERRARRMSKVVRS